ncbi:MAG: hypothetical protein JO353_10375, partial [Phycisphaerae bacterium]|nr:hypothetical protein [Phycisphaerae bacterium]
MRHWYAGLSLRTKVTGISVAITALSLAAVASIGIWQIGREIAAEQHRTADSVALGVARASELPMTVRDAKELSRLANSFLRDDDVLFVAVYGSGPKPLAMAVSDAKAWNEFTRGAVDRYRGIVGTHAIEVLAASNEFVDDAEADPSNTAAASPKPASASPQVLGRVIVCLSTASTMLAEEQQIRLTIAATALAALIGAGILFLTFRSWMRRLHALAEASRSISRGDFDISISDPHDD